MITLLELIPKLNMFSSFQDNNSVTDLTSSDQVTQLCERFGYTLEHLTIAELQLLRAILANHITIESACKPLSLTESMLETENMIHQATNKYPSVSGAVFVAVGILEGIGIDTAEELISSITKLIKSEAIARHQESNDSVTKVYLKRSRILGARMIA